MDALHHFEAEVLVHGIATTRQLKAALHTGADLVQGRLFGVPTQAIEVEAFAPIRAENQTAVRGLSRQFGRAAAVTNRKNHNEYF